MVSHKNPADADQVAHALNGLNLNHNNAGIRRSPRRSPPHAPKRARHARRFNNLPNGDRVVRALNFENPNPNP